MNNPNYTKALQLYENGIGTNTIAKTLNFHRSTIQQWIKKSSHKLRKASPRYNYDVHFFSTYTPESCYWAGFIMADGCIRNTTLHIKLANKDRLHLQKFLNCIKSNYPINGKIYSYINISGQWFLNDLSNNFGITKRKTFTTKFPNIPASMESHFIRGLLDGDGCITITTCPTINFIGTIELMTSLANKFKNLNIKLKSGNETPPIQIKNKNIGVINYSGKNANKILKWIYNKSNISMRLDRKFEKYVKIFHSDANVNNETNLPS